MTSKPSSKQFLGAIFIFVVAAMAYYGPFGRSKKFPPTYLVGEYKTKKTKGKATLIGEDGHILRRWPIPFSVHKVTHNKAQAWQLVAVENLGDSMALIDSRQKTVADVTKSPDGLIFSGHAVFSGEGDKVFVTAQDKSTAEGFVLVYDATTAELTTKIPSEGFNPHDLQYDLAHPDQLIVMNAGTSQNSGNMVWISDTDNKIVKSVPAPAHPLALKHFLQVPAGDIYVYGPASFGVFNRKDGEIKMSDWPQKDAKYSGEILNAYRDGLNEKIWLTLPSSDLIVVLDIKTLKVVKTFAATKPASIMASPLENPELLMISVGTYDGEGMQKAFELKNVSGSDAALENPRKFYSEHATPLEVAIQDAN